MEFIGNLLMVVATFGVAWGVLGAIKPMPAMKVSTRRQGLLILGASMVLGMIAVSMVPDTATPSELAAGPTTTSARPTTSDMHTSTTAPPTTTTTAAPTTTLPPTTLPLNPKEAIEARVRQALGDDLVRVSALEQVDGGYGVSVVMNVSDNLTTGLIATGIKDDAGEVMTALFAEEPDLDVRWVTIEGLFPLTDRYGNTSPGDVLSLRFRRQEAEKVNWDYPGASLRLDLLPDLYEWLFIHPDLREHLP